jgi:hypothetical protein
MLTRPRWLLQTEGACYLALGLALYRAGHFPWWLFLALFLAPDLFLLGYLANARIGSAFYNLAHTLVWPIALGFLGSAGSSTSALRTHLAFASGLRPDAGLWTEVPHKFPRYPPRARLIGEASSLGRSCGSG